jgi:hypothetical protein
MACSKRRGGSATSAVAAPSPQRFSAMLIGARAEEHNASAFHGHEGCRSRPCLIGTRWDVVHVDVGRGKTVGSAPRTDRSRHRGREPAWRTRPPPLSFFLQWRHAQRGDGENREGDRRRQHDERGAVHKRPRPFISASKAHSSTSIRSRAAARLSAASHREDYSPRASPTAHRLQRRRSCACEPQGSLDFPQSCALGLQALANAADYWPRYRATAGTPAPDEVRFVFKLPLRLYLRYLKAIKL